MGRRLAPVAVAALGLLLPCSSLAASGQLQNGVMIYTADPGETNNVIFTTNTFGSPTFEVRDAPSVNIAATPPCFNGGSNNIMECPQDGGGTGQVVLLQATLGDGADTFSVQEPNLPTTVDAGGGNDVLSGGPSVDTFSGGSGDDTLDGGGGNDVENGGDGNDTIIGNQGDDTLSGGAGNDTFPAEATNDGADDVSGGDGTDTATYAARTTPVQVSLDDQANDGTIGQAADNIHSDVENVVGGSGGDVLSGSGAANNLDGGPGDDTLSGQGGDDTLTGGDGNDTVAGGDGGDTLNGDAGNDTLDGGAGADTLNGGDGTDTGDYSSRTDGVTVTLDGTANDGAPGEGDNVEPDVENLNGGSGPDTLIGSAASNTLNGGGGENYEDGGSGGADTLVGGDSGDVLRSRDNPQPDTISCGQGPDFVIAKPTDNVSPDCHRVDRGVNQKPKLGDSAVVTPAGGSLQMSPAGIVRSVPLLDKVVLPLASVVDTLSGAVKVTSAATTRKTQTISLDQGAFDITQTAGKLPVTQFALQGGDFSICALGAPSPGTTATAAAATKTTVIRHLWANGKGNFRTRARYASAIVRGTRWETVDRCDGTLIRVAKGVVLVRDLVKKKNVLVTAGHSYLAKAR